jgi:hypothetical protein
VAAAVLAAVVAFSVVFILAVARAPRQPPPYTAPTLPVAPR